MAKSYTQVNFRIPEKLKEQLEQAAKENENSITAELVARLEQSFKQNESQSDQIEQLQQQVANSMKIMEIMSGFFESMINGNQEEYFESLTQKYPMIKKIYERQKAINKKDPE